ncbi:class I SAM-dependent methyltransferase [candidate division KSB1 bacterium]|nr:MAG: class I SAM-dependent methyltransferase [candidate division KSB1 bacterium]
MSRDELEKYYDHVRKDVIDLLPAGIVLSKTLDVGCGRGATSRYLKEKYNIQETIGIEKCESIARQAGENVDRIHSMSVESDELPFHPDEFDLILCADVLEHLADPWRAVERCAGYLKSGGYFLASLPNVQNWKIILKLLFGRWHYQESGLLDRSHLRFFTHKTAVEMLESAGLSIISVKKTMGPEMRLMNILTCGLFQDLLSYRIYMCAQKL